jgi:hypothetical protein
MIQFSKYMLFSKCHLPALTGFAILSRGFHGNLLQVEKFHRLFLLATWGEAERKCLLKTPVSILQLEFFILQLFSLARFI